MHTIEAKTILSARNGMNIYRGCTHGCIYCDSRSECYNMQHAFEDVEVKANAAELLEDALKRKRKKCMIGTGAMSDPYIPQEAELGNFRRILEIIDRYGFGIAVQTKSDIILRDLGILKSINGKTKCVVQMTLTTFDERLCRKIEPNVCTTARRAEVLNIMRDNGIPTVVWLSPILPFINDTEENIKGIIEYCRAASVYGIICFGMGLTLRSGNREYFYDKVDKLFPQMSQKYRRIYGNSYIVNSPKNEKLMRLFNDLCQKCGIVCDNDKIFAYLNTFEQKRAYEQMKLF